ncbi:MAG: glycosyltransferase family 39 protein [Cellvibrionales bacterium]|nr:glycosyltransferase family 39 protein [Cellvibrionales bacterium]
MQVSNIARTLNHALYTKTFLIGAFILVVCLNLGIPPLVDVDEGAFSEATREMVASGNYAATYLDGEPRYDKPILIYWFQSSAVKVLGVNEWAFRLPSAIFAALWLIALFGFAREQIGKNRAHVAAVSLVSLLLFGLVARAAFADALLNLLLSLALFDIYRYYKSPKQTLIFRVYLWMGLGMLTKGPVAVAIPLVTTFLFFLWQQKPKDMIKAFFHPIGWLIFLLILLPWLYLVYQDQGLGFFKGFLIDHNLQRFTQTKEGHGGKIYYYLLIFPLIILPFSFLLKKPFLAFKAKRQPELSKFLWLWMVIVLVIFSFSDTQLPHYVMNATVPFVILLAMNSQRYRKRSYYFLPLLFAALLFLALPFFGQYFDGKAPTHVAEMLQGTMDAFPYYYYLLALTLFLIYGFLAFCNKLPLWPSLALAGIAQSIFIYYALFPALAALQQNPIKEAAMLAKQYNANVVRFNITHPSFSVYREAITEKRLPKASEWVLTRAGQTKKLQAEIAPLQLLPIYANGGIRLFEVSN